MTGLVIGIGIKIARIARRLKRGEGTKDRQEKTGLQRRSTVCPVPGKSDAQPWAGVELVFVKDLALA